MRAPLFLIASTIFWGLNFHLAKVLLSEASFIEAGFWRYLFGMALLFVASKRQLGGNLLTMSKPARKGVLLVGIIGLWGFNMVFFIGLQYTTALNAALIVSLNPVLTLLFSRWILGTSLNLRQKVGMWIAFVGVLFLLGKGNPLSLLQIVPSSGDLLIFVANAIFALHHVWVKMYAHHLPNRRFTFLTNLICLLGFVVLLPWSSIGSPLLHAGGFWLAVLGIGFLGTGLAYLFWNRGVQLMGAPKAGVFMNIVPLAAAVFAVFFGESLHGYHALSGALILIGMLILQGVGMKPASSS